MDLALAGLYLSLEHIASVINFPLCLLSCPNKVFLLLKSFSYMVQRQSTGADIAFHPVLARFKS